MAINAERRSKFAALHRQWWRLQISEKFSSGTKNSKQTRLNLIVWMDTHSKIFLSYEKPMKIWIFVC